jgi:hypothetical protein
MASPGSMPRQVVPQTWLGEGPDGELYVLTQQNGLFEIEPS